MEKWKFEHKGTKETELGASVEKDALDGLSRQVRGL
jgi:hypothetical protein